MFKNRRNFTIISKKKYGIYIRLLNVKIIAIFLMLLVELRMSPYVDILKLKKKKT